MSATTARKLLQQLNGNAVISLYLDLAGEFATPPARASQIRSLLDEAGRRAERLSLSHDARRTLEADLARLEAELVPDDLPASGARGLAVFCSGADDLFLTIPLHGAVSQSVFVEPAAHVEPLVRDPAAARWCAVFVSADGAEIVEGVGDRVTAHTQSSDFVRGRTQVGGAHTHAREQDVAGHLHQVAAELRRRHEAGEFELLALGGPVEAVTGLESQLPDELSAALAGRLSLDRSSSSDADVTAAVGELIARRRAESDEACLAELRDRLGSGERIAVGVQAVEEALVQRSVQTLLLGRDLDDADNRREAMVQTAVLQDADVRAFDQPHDELPPARPVAALLRY